MYTYPGPLYGSTTLVLPYHIIYIIPVSYPCFHAAALHRSFIITPIHQPLFLLHFFGDVVDVTSARAVAERDRTLLGVVLLLAALEHAAALQHLRHLRQQKLGTKLQALLHEAARVRDDDFEEVQRRRVVDEPNVRGGAAPLSLVLSLPPDLDDFVRRAVLVLFVRELLVEQVPVQLGREYSPVDRFADGRAWESNNGA